MLNECKCSLFSAPTAYCKNSIDGQWYCFDDSEVQPVADDDVCQQTAYILFYQRRTAIPSWSANSSVAGEGDTHSVDCAGQRKRLSLKDVCLGGMLCEGCCVCLFQAPPARLFVTTGSTGCRVAGLPAWPRGPPPDALLWPRWPSQGSFRGSVWKTMVRETCWNPALFSPVVIRLPLPPPVHVWPFPEPVPCLVKTCYSNLLSEF